MQVVLHGYQQISSSAHCPSSAFLQCKSLPGDLPHVSVVPLSPPLGGAANYSLEGGLLTQ